MKKRAKLFICVAVWGSLCLLGCHREGRVDATRSLQQSFQASEPEVKQAIATASSSLKAGDYTDAARVLNPVLAGRQLTAEQKQAAGLLFQQINQALMANPNLESKELYELREKLHRGVTGGTRF
jgi:hypothetical protein